MKRILITDELAQWLSSQPVLNCTDMGMQIGHTIIIRDLSKLSLENESNPIHNKYILVLSNGYGYPFDCGEEQINQMLAIIAEDIKQQDNDPNISLQLHQSYLFNSWDSLPHFSVLYV